MSDDWKDKLRELQKKTSSEEKKTTSQGGHVAKKGARAFQEVDPKRTWGGGRGTGRATPRDRSKKPADELPPEPPAGEGGTVNVGVDVGTSTTKVCARALRAREKDPAYAISLQKIGDGVGRSLLCPSTVTLTDGRIYFGHEAERQARTVGAKVFRHLKVCVGCEVGSTPKIPVSGCTCLRFQGSEHCSAIFPLPDKAGEAWASELLVLFLAWAMCQSRTQLPEELTGGRVPRTTYSVCAPVDQVDAGSQLNQAYARVAFQAWRLSAGVEQAMPFAQALRLVRTVQEVPLPPTQERLVELCPESSATVAAYAMSPEMEEGLYCVADIGAWTTEISLFRFTEIRKGQAGRSTKAFYAARSHRVAANEVDERCRGLLLQLYAVSPQGSSLSAEEIREQRERGAFGEEPVALEVGKTKKMPRQSPLEYASDLVGEEIQRGFIQTLSEAYAKEKRVGRSAHRSAFWGRIARARTGHGASTLFRFPLASRPPSFEPRRGRGGGLSQTSGGLRSRPWERSMAARSPPLRGTTAGFFSQEGASYLGRAGLRRALNSMRPGSPWRCQGATTLATN